MKKILVLNHFPAVYPPTSGGTLRYFYLYQELSQYYDITLLSQTFGHKGGLFNYSPSFRENKVEKDHFYKQIIQELGHSEITYEYAIIIQTELAKHTTLYKQRFDTLYQTSDIIVHESPFLLEYDQTFGFDRKPRIYNSHNHEYLLADQIWKDTSARKYLPSIYQLEKRLVCGADLVFSTSEIEKSSFISMYGSDPGKVKIAPNGSNPEELSHKKRFSERLTALFMGADYPPNIEAVDYIIHQLADKCPMIDFVIAGGCCSSFPNHDKFNVKLLGRVSHKHKLKLLETVDIAINPMFTGAGVNLKTLEFLASGIPLFSTLCGARGLNLIDKHHYIHAEKDNFAEKLNQYGKNESLLKKISSNGQQYINNHYTWRNIAKNISHEIEKIIPQ